MCPEYLAPLANRRGIALITAVFATRAPDRPNPIGFSVLKIEDVYGIRIDVTTDPATGILRTHPVGRHTARRVPQAAPR